MIVQFGNSGIQKIQKFPLTAKLNSAYRLVQFSLSSEIFPSNYFQTGQCSPIICTNIIRDGRVRSLKAIEERTLHITK